MSVTDRAHVSDSVEAGLAEYAEPNFPCPRCGKESLEHTPLHLQERRICSAEDCRFVFFFNENVLQEMKRRQEQRG